MVKDETNCLICGPALGPARGLAESVDQRGNKPIGWIDP